MERKLVALQVTKLGGVFRTLVDVLQGLINSGVFRKSRERWLEQAGCVGEESEIGILETEFTAQPKGSGESRFQPVVSSNGCGTASHRKIHIGQLLRDNKVTGIANRSGL